MKYQKLFTTKAMVVTGGSQEKVTAPMTTTTAIIHNRPLTIQTFKLEPGMQIDQLIEAEASGAGSDSSFEHKIKLEPGLLQTLPPQATPLKVEIQDNYLDSGQNIKLQTSFLYLYY